MLLWVLPKPEEDTHTVFTGGLVIKTHTVMDSWCVTNSWLPKNEWMDGRINYCDCQSALIWLITFISD